MIYTRRDVENILILAFVASAFVALMVGAATTPTAPAPTPPPLTVVYGVGARPGIPGVYFSIPAAMVWRVTDISGKTHTYPEKDGWGCIGGGVEAGAFLVECRRLDAAGREAERVEMVAVRLEHGAGGER